MKRIIRIALSVILTISTGMAFYTPVSARTVIASKAEKLEYTGGDGYTMPYRLYVPEKYDESKKYPVLLFLHGAGERGNDNVSQLSNAIQVLFNTREKLLKNTIVICPQCPNGEQWVSYDWSQGNYSTKRVKESRAIQAALAILSDVESKYSCDADRVYAFGLSMGGYGVWDLLARHGELFAAGVPCCGGGDESKAEELSEIPIWCYHGTADDIVKYQGTKGMYDAISAYGRERITFTSVKGAGHNVWDAAASNEELIDWMYAQNLSLRYPEQEEPQDTDDPVPTDDAPEQTPGQTTSPKNGWVIPVIAGTCALAALAAAAVVAVVVIRKRRS